MQKGLIRNGLVFSVIVLFIGIAVIPSTAIILNNDNTANNHTSSVSPQFLRTIYVDDDNTEGPWDGTLAHPYLKIIDGMEVANTGDTVYVFNGDYNEGDVYFHKSINLIGESKTDTRVNIDLHVGECGRVKIQGFNFRCTWQHHSLFIAYVLSAYISGNIFTEAGIIILTSLATVTNNIFENITEDAIIVSNAFRNTISKNSFENIGRTAVKIKYSALNRIYENNFIGNNRNAFFEDSILNNWDGNYWDDWIGWGGYKINGVHWIPNYGGDPIPDPRVQYDFSPADEPFDIPDSSNIPEYNIDELSRTIDFPFLQRFPLLNLLLQRLRI